MKTIVFCLAMLAACGICRAQDHAAKPEPAKNDAVKHEAAKKETMQQHEAAPHGAVHGEAHAAESDEVYKYVRVPEPSEWPEAMVRIILAMFCAAIVAGMLSSIIGLSPPPPAAAGHDDHGHDAHAAGGHGAGGHAAGGHH